jgi:hypothetical protein
VGNKATTTTVIDIDSSDYWQLIAVTDSEKTTIIVAAIDTEREDYYYNSY